MSDILNHYYCAREAFMRLHEKNPLTKIILNNYDAYRLGTQGPDFLYYDLIDQHAGLAHKIANMIHTKHIDLFFYFGLEFAKEHPEYKDMTIAYLSGFASHHALDTLTHPFIFYRTGKYKKGNPDTRIYAYLHKLYEVLLDTAMVQYEYNTQAVFQNPEKVFVVSPSTLKFLEEFYEYVIRETYDIDLPKKTIKRALKNAYKVIKYSKDPTSRKKKYLKKLERLLKQDHSLSRLLYPMYTNEFLMLNIANKPWRHPVTGEEHDESYPQLFHKAIDKSVHNMNLLYKLANKEYPNLSKISDLFENRSYLSALPVDESRWPTHFDEEFISLLSSEY